MKWTKDLDRANNKLNSYLRNPKSKDSILKQNLRNKKKLWCFKCFFILPTYLIARKTYNFWDCGQAIFMRNLNIRLQFKNKWICLIPSHILIFKTPIFHKLALLMVSSAQWLVKFAMLNQVLKLSYKKLCGMPSTIRRNKSKK